MTTKQAKKVCSVCGTSLDFSDREHGVFELGRSKNITTYCQTHVKEELDRRCKAAGIRVRAERKMDAAITGQTQHEATLAQWKKSAAEKKARGGSMADKYKEYEAAEQTMDQRIKAMVGKLVKDSEGHVIGVFNQFGGVDFIGGAA